MLRGTRYGNKQPTRADHRASLLFTLTARDKPATDRDFASWARSHRMSVEEVRALWAEIAARRCAGG
jgi:hypothetical protein